MTTSWLARGRLRLLAATFPLVAAVPLAELVLPADAADGASAASVHQAQVKQGDWEVQGTSVQGSFLVATATRRVHRKVQRFLAVEDLVVNAPITCSNSPGAAAPDDLEVVASAAPVSSAGTFSVGKLARSGGTQVRGSLRHGRFAITYRHISRTQNPFDGGMEVCDTGTIHLATAPGHRRTIADGEWTGQTQNNEPVKLNVVAGGRALQTETVRKKTVEAFEVDPVSAGDNCPGQTGSGGTDSGGGESGVGAGAAYRIPQGLFIAPNGTFDNSQLQYGDSQAVTGTFTSARNATGTFANPQAGCSWTWGATP